ncbi:preprotein translocase subunit SecE [Candidatus Woesebacteria bacterium RIFCSPLOWO2_01_FULL_37_19]|uniref:Protein translocase subunit SecE n=2 Tax=Candidatus Woeseibacteriota TaxID=1752722 RepID=A0A1F8B3A8_9BACT|nr:MAG: preprotein translocase subunit SecE [Candidatus Woesebacteria bacterium RIFCSPHIGHO2_01_FULL_38_26b]OGM58504.1 MAG: preprotein translocase subunit SecE [Candidatus Woesebacteria bacterium RIFCSPLOWO2_01_FULL_37_19]
MKTIVNYFNEVRSELTKVVWPKREEVVKLTLTVFLISGIVAAYLGLLDFSFTKLLELIVSF